MVEQIKLGVAIAGIVSTIITTILTIYSKKETSKKGKIIELAKVVQKLPNYIQAAEEMFGAGKGKVKKQYVLNEARNECLLNDIEFKKDEFSEEVEKILETPQKKEK